MIIVVITLSYLEASVVREIGVSFIFLKVHKTIKMIHIQLVRRGFHQTSRSQLIFKKTCAIPVILVFSIPGNSPSETHRDVKCFKRAEHSEHEEGNYDLTGDKDCEKQVCLFSFPSWLSLLSHEKEMKHQKESHYHQFTGYCHWLSINLIVHLSYKSYSPFMVLAF